MFIACATNAQTDETSQGCNDCNTITLRITGHSWILMPGIARCNECNAIATDHSQPVNNPQDQSTPDPQKPDPQKPDPQKNGSPTKVNILTGIGRVSQDGYKPLTGKERFHLYLNQTFVPPEAYLGALLSSGVDQIGNDPPEWGQGLKGYGIRFASRFGTNFVQNSIQAAGAAALHEEPRYVSSSSKGFFHRSEHALLFTLVTYNNSGKVTPAIASVGSTYAASMITTLWMPKRYTMLGDGVRDGNLQLGLNGAFNIFEEFLPDIKKVFKH